MSAPLEAGTNTEATRCVGQLTKALLAIPYPVPICFALTSMSEGEIAFYRNFLDSAKSLSYLQGFVEHLCKLHWSAFLDPALAPQLESCRMPRSRSLPGDHSIEELFLRRALRAKAALGEGALGDSE
ncbi:UNVERIFIED_CONTAM: hypothetical protein K2H54_033253 [Gekko kuhli]